MFLPNWNILSKVFRKFLQYVYSDNGYWEWLPLIFHLSQLFLHGNEIKWSSRISFHGPCMELSHTLLCHLVHTDIRNWFVRSLQAIERNVKITKCENSVFVTLQVSWRSNYFFCSFHHYLFHQCCYKFVKIVPVTNLGSETVYIYENLCSFLCLFM